MDYVPETQDELDKLARKKLFFKIRLIITATVLFLAVALGILLPKLLNREYNAPIYLADPLMNAEIEIERRNLKDSDIKRLKKQVAQAPEKNTPEEVAGPVLEPDETVQEKLKLASPAQKEGAGPPTEDKQPPPISLSKLLVQPLNFPPKATGLKTRQIRETIAGFYAASAPEEKAAYVSEPGRVLPFMQEYYARGDHPNNDALGEIGARSFFLIEGQEYAIQQHFLADSNSITYVCLHNQGDNVFKIDWESMVGYGEMGWGEFLEKRPTQPTLFRCLATEAEYYNYGFDNPKKWASFKLEHPHSNDIIYGYARRGSATEIKLRSSLVNRPRVSVILRLSLPKDGKGRNLARIDEFQQETWLVVR